MANRTIDRAGVLVAAALLLPSGCSSARPPRAVSAESPSPQVTYSTGHDVGLTVVSGQAEVNVPFVVTFRVSNAGPDDALGIVTVKDLIPVSGFDVWVGSVGGGTLVAYDPGAVAGGAEVSRKGILRFVSPAVARVEAFIGPDEPPDRNPSNNEVTIEVEVSAPACTVRASGRGGVNVRNRAQRQVVCSGNGDDTITAGDRDAIRSGGGEDRVTCTQTFCVLELGRGDDEARCPGACYVNGGPGKDTCPRGEDVIKENCER